MTIKRKIRDPVPLPQMPRGFNPRSSAHDKYHDDLSRCLYDWAQEYVDVVTQLITQSQVYVVGMTYNGTIPASTVLVRHPVPIVLTFPIGLITSVCKADTAATAQTDFDVQKNGVSFGTIRFAVAGVTATFISVAGATFAAGDILKVIAPATPDATLAGLGFSLYATM